MRGKGLRHILPIVSSLLYVILVLWGYPGECDYHRDAGIIDTVFEPPRSFAWAVGISLPAALVTLPGALWVGRYSADAADLSAMLVTGILTPWLWFVVGRWFDRKLAWRQVERATSPSPRRFTLNIFAGVLLATDVFLVYALLFTRIHHRLILADWIAFWSFLGWWYCLSPLHSPVPLPGTAGTGITKIDD